jgi:hypothetical protein
MNKKFKVCLSVAALTLVAILVSCASNQVSSTYTLTHYTPTGHIPNPCVAFSMSAPNKVAVGAGLTATLMAENICNETVTLQLGGLETEAHSDLLVTNQSGEVLFQSLYEVVRTLGLTPKPIAPGERLSFEGSWSGRDNWGEIIPAGTYRLIGILYSPDESDAPVYRPENQNFEAVQTLKVGN